MHRRDFIRKFTGNDPKIIFFWAGIILLLIVFLNLGINQQGNWLSLPGTNSANNSFGEFIKLLLIVIVGFVVLVIILSLVRYLVIRLFNALPAPVSGWFKKYGRTILHCISGLILCYLIYDAFVKEKYFLLVVMFLYTIISLLARGDSKMEKS
jgi:hypothetical protein